MTDGENLLASVQDRVSLVFLVRTFQLFRASHGYGVIALRAATASHGVDDIVISVFLEPMQTFHTLTLIVTQQAERLSV